MHNLVAFFSLAIISTTAFSTPLSSGNEEVGDILITIQNMAVNKQRMTSFQRQPSYFSPKYVPSLYGRRRRSYQRKSGRDMLLELKDTSSTMATVFSHRKTDLQFQYLISTIIGQVLQYAQDEIRPKISSMPKEHDDVTKVNSPDQGNEELRKHLINVCVLPGLNKVAS